LPTQHQAKKTNKVAVMKVAVTLLLVLAGCGYDGGFRYSCQDPVNWEAKECNPPICKADDTCTKDLIGQ